MAERRERLAATKAGDLNDLRIVEEVSRLAEESGFVTCPMTGHQMNVRTEGKRGPPGPPTWAVSVLKR